MAMGAVGETSTEVEALRSRETEGGAPNCSEKTEWTAVNGGWVEPAPLWAASITKRRTNRRRQSAGATTFLVFLRWSYGASPRVPPSCTHQLGPTASAIRCSCRRRPPCNRPLIPHIPPSADLIGCSTTAHPTSTRRPGHEWLKRNALQHRTWPPELWPPPWGRQETPALNRQPRGVLPAGSAGRWPRAVREARQ